MVAPGRGGVLTSEVPLSILIPMAEMQGGKSKGGNEEEGGHGMPKKLAAIMDQDFSDTGNHPTQDQTRINCQSRFLEFQGQYTPKVEISGREVPERYSTSWITFYNCSA